MFDLILIVTAIAVSILALTFSSAVRAICWDSFFHPRYVCHWTREHGQMRELKAGIDYPAES